MAGEEYPPTFFARKRGEDPKVYLRGEYFGNKDDQERLNKIYNFIRSFPGNRNPSSRTYMKGNGAISYAGFPFPAERKDEVEKKIIAIFGSIGTKPSEIDFPIHEGI